MVLNLSKIRFHIINRLIRYVYILNTSSIYIFSDLSDGIYFIRNVSNVIMISYRFEYFSLFNVKWILTFSFGLVCRRFLICIGHNLKLYFCSKIPKVVKSTKSLKLFFWESNTKTLKIQMIGYWFKLIGLEEKLDNFNSK